MSDKLLKALHEPAQGLHPAGTMEAVTLREFDATVPATGQGLQRGADQAAAPAQQGESGRVRGMPEHQRIDGAEMGTGPEAAEWALGQAARSG